MADFLNTHTSERTGIFISAEFLPKMDMTSNTDPFAVLYIKSLKDDLWKRAGHTEVIMDTQNPSWPIMFTMEYFFEMKQEIEVRIFDQDAGKPLDNEAEHELIGSAFFELSRLMTGPNQAMKIKLEGKKALATSVCKLRAEPISNVRDIFHCNIKCENLSNVDGFFRKSDPFLRFRRVYEDGTWVTVHETKFVDGDLNPTFNQIAIDMGSLNNGDNERPIKIEVWDNESSGKHQAMGEATTSMATLIRNNEAGKKTKLDIKGKADGKPATGTVCYDKIVIEKRPTFSDFVMGGCEITLVVGIDFTSSNGIVTDPKSLHHTHGGAGVLNPYEQAIYAVGNIISEYDTDKMFPVFGFGAKTKLENGSFGPINHNFQVNKGPAEVRGVEGIINAYRGVVNELMFSGPTCFTPIINSTIARAKCTQEKQQYTILLMITDGTITDLDTTIDAIIAASNAPMSILIIGVGPEDFSSMEQLDADKKTLKANGETAKRDCVQFVSFRDFSGKRNTMLASEVLREIPTQVLQYMFQHKIVPNPKKA